MSLTEIGIVAAASVLLSAGTIFGATSGFIIFSIFGFTDRRNAFSSDTPSDWCDGFVESAFTTSALPRRTSGTCVTNLGKRSIMFDKRLAFFEL